MYQSTQGQDRWVIERVFPGKRGGWFVDAGAGPDGIRGSNSYLLEKQQGWTGLLVEPHPECFERVKSNRSAIVEHCCLSDSSGEVEFAIHHEHPELSSITQYLSEPNFVAAGYDRVAARTVRTPTVPLWELLRRHHAPPVIDYLSLDIEGAEWIALKDFPFGEFRVRCMTVETGGEGYDRLRAKLRAEGFRLVRFVYPDDFWVHGSVEYRTGVGERLDAEVRAFWNGVYFREPMLTARRAARRVRRAVRGR